MEKENLSQQEQLILNTEKLERASKFSFYSILVICMSACFIFAKLEYAPNLIPHLIKSRPINGGSYIISTSSFAHVSYTIGIQCISSMKSNSSGQVSLQYSDNEGKTWNDISSISNSNEVTKDSLLETISNNHLVLCGDIPKNCLVRMNSTLDGTTTITFIKGEETY